MIRWPASIIIGIDDTVIPCFNIYRLIWWWMQSVGCRGLRTRTATRTRWSDESVDVRAHTHAARTHTLHAHACHTRHARAHRLRAFRTRLRVIGVCTRTRVVTLSTSRRWLFDTVMTIDDIDSNYLIFLAWWWWYSVSIYSTDELPTCHYLLLKLSSWNYSWYGDDLMIHSCDIRIIYWWYSWWWWWWY